LPSGRPRGNADNFVIDLGGGDLGSNGQNSIVNTVGDVFRLEGLEDVFINAKGNWWGSPLGLAESRVNTDFSINSGVIAVPALEKEPKRKHGCSKKSGKSKGSKKKHHKHHCKSKKSGR